MRLLETQVNEHKYAYLKQSIQLLSLCFVLFLSSCSDETEIIEENQDLESFTYQYSNDLKVQVLLDPNKVQEHRTFSSLEAYEEAEELLAKKGQIVVNQDLYNDLKHYFSPFEIYFMDAEGKITVGKYGYLNTTTASYEKEGQFGEYELSVFYGKSGKVNLEETELIHKNIENLEVLSNYSFKSPWAEELYKEKLTNINKIDRSYHSYRNSNGSLKQVKYRTSPNGPVRIAYIRWYCWNESYRRRFNRKRSRGGTITQILRDNLSSGRWESMTGKQPIGQFHANGTRDNSIPRTVVRVQPNGRNIRYATANEWSIVSSDHGRDANRGTTSYHSAYLRSDNSNSHYLRLNNVKLN